MSDKCDKWDFKTRKVIEPTSMSDKKTIKLNIPRTAEERAARSAEWHCAGCGVAVPDLVKCCDCITMVACRGFGPRTSTWMIDPNKPTIESFQSELARLTADLARKDAALREAYEILAFAFNRIHALPRSRDTELASDIGKVRAKIEKALTPAHHRRTDQ